MSRNRSTFMALGALALSSCDAPQASTTRAAPSPQAPIVATSTIKAQAPKPPAPARAVPSENWATNCDPAKTLTADPIGRPLANLIKTYGPPLGDTRFTLGDDVHPGRMTLLNIYPLPANEDRQLRELSWTRSGCIMTLWLVDEGRGWIATHGLKSSTEAEF